MLNQLVKIRIAPVYTYTSNDFLYYSPGWSLNKSLSLSCWILNKSLSLCCWILNKSLSLCCWILRARENPLKKIKRGRRGRGDGVEDDDDDKEEERSCCCCSNEEENEEKYESRKEEEVR